MIINLWHDFFGTISSTASTTEILEYSLCGIVAVLVITLFFKLVIGFFNAFFKK